MLGWCRRSYSTFKGKNSMEASRRNPCIETSGPHVIELPVSLRPLRRSEICLYRKCSPTCRLEWRAGHAVPSVEVEVSTTGTAVAGGVSTCN
jgi:hypothetical protein